jgi:hypothetical protein
MFFIVYSFFVGLSSEFETVRPIGNMGLYRRCGNSNAVAVNVVVDHGDAWRKGCARWRQLARPQIGQFSF